MAKNYGFGKHHRISFCKSRQQQQQQQGCQAVGAAAIIKQHVMTNIKRVFDAAMCKKSAPKPTVTPDILSLCVTNLLEHVTYIYSLI